MPKHPSACDIRREFEAARRLAAELPAHVTAFYRRTFLITSEVVAELEADEERISRGLPPSAVGRERIDRLLSELEGELARLRGEVASPPGGPPS